MLPLRPPLKMLVLVGSLALLLPAIAQARPLPGRSGGHAGPHRVGDEGAHAEQRPTTQRAASDRDAA